MNDLDEQWRSALEWVFDKTHSVVDAEAKFRVTRSADRQTWLAELTRLETESDRWRDLRRGVMEQDARVLHVVQAAMVTSRAKDA